MPDSVTRLRCAICDFAQTAGVADPPLEDLRLAVSEAVTNAVLHGYRGRARPGPIEVQAMLDDHTLSVVVADSGIGFAPRLDSPGLGLGLPLIAELTDRLQVRERRPNGTELHMTFRLTR